MTENFEEKLKEEEQKMKEDFEEKLEELEIKMEAAVAKGETRFPIIKHQLNLTSGVDDAKAEDKKLEAKMEVSHASHGKHFCIISKPAPPCGKQPHII